MSGQLRIAGGICGVCGSVFDAPVVRLYEGEILHITCPEGHRTDWKVVHPQGEVRVTTAVKP